MAGSATLSFGKCVYNCRTPESVGQPGHAAPWHCLLSKQEQHINSAANNANTKNLIKSAFSKLNCSLCIQRKEKQETRPYLSPSNRTLSGNCSLTGGLLMVEGEQGHEVLTFSIWTSWGGGGARTSLYAVCGSVSTCPASDNCPLSAWPTYSKCTYTQKYFKCSTRGVRRTTRTVIHQDYFVTLMLLMRF